MAAAAAGTYYGFLWLLSSRVKSSAISTLKKRKQPTKNTPQTMAVQGLTCKQTARGTATTRGKRKRQSAYLPRQERLRDEAPASHSLPPQIRQSPPQLTAACYLRVTLGSLSSVLLSSPPGVQLLAI